MLTVLPPPFPTRRSSEFGGAQRASPVAAGQPAVAIGTVADGDGIRAEDQRAVGIDAALQAHPLAPDGAVGRIAKAIDRLHRAIGADPFDRQQVRQRGAPAAEPTAGIADRKSTRLNSST